MIAAKILIKNCISTLVFCVGFFYCVLPVYVRLIRNDKDKFAFCTLFLFFANASFTQQKTTKQ